MSDSEESCSDVEDYMPLVPLDEADSFDTDEESPKLNGKFYEGTEEIEIDLSKVVYPGNSYSKRGYFLIFNHQKFGETSRYKDRPRRGSEADVKRLKKLFGELEFEIEVCNDFTREQTLEKLRSYHKMKMKNCEMFAMAILTHGEDHGRLFTYDDEMHLNDYIKPIKMNEYLVGKPKLFFVQACRGHEYMDGWRVKSGMAQKTTSPIYRSWPLDADILIHYATTEGHLSWRSPVNGSWFITTLCNILRWAYHEELHHLLVRVNSVVALNFESVTGSESSNHKKQMPQIQTQLTKLVYMKPKTLAITE